MTDVLNAERLRHLVAYDPVTGVFTRLANRHRTRIGQVIRSVHCTTGYMRASIDGRRYDCHRLAWLHFYGVWPTHEIDHINGVRTDNRIANLRDVTTLVNRQNERIARPNNSTGMLGVSAAPRGRFFALIRHDGRQKCLGTFDTALEAHSVYVDAKRRLHEGNTL